MKAGDRYRRTADRARGDVLGWGPDGVDMRVDLEGPAEPVTYKALAHEWEQVTETVATVGAQRDEIEILSRRVANLEGALAALPGRERDEQARRDRIAGLVRGEPEAVLGRDWIDVAGDVLARLLKVKP